MSLSSENFDSFGVTGTENPPPTTLHNHSAIRAVSNNRSFRPDTNYILGPPSTFSQWASFYGNKPMLHLSGRDQKIELEKFQVADLHTIP